MHSIRMASGNDAQALLDIYNQYIETPVTFEYTLPSREEFQSRIRETSREYPYLVLEQDGQIVGYAYAHRRGERAAYRWCAELSIYLDQNSRGKGLGRHLYQTLFALLRLQNIQSVYACITVPNPRSIGLHRSLGFEEAGRWPKAGYKNGGWHDVLWMMKEIGPHPDIPAPFRPIREIPPEEIARILREAAR